MAKWTKLGALWNKKSKSGHEFLTGEITIDEIKTKISVWPNDKQGNEKRPDFNIYLSEEMASLSAKGHREPGDDDNPSNDGSCPF